MKKLYIVIIDQASLDNILIDRIRACSEDNYRFWENHWLIASESSAQVIYDTLAADSYSNVPIYVQEINVIQGSFWGRMNKNLWDWMKAHMSSDNT